MSENTINNDVAKEIHKFCERVQSGTWVIGNDDICVTSFTLLHETEDLTLDLFYAMDFALRPTSVGEEGGSRDDSLKIGGTAPEEPDDPVDDCPVTVANADSLMVCQSETFSEEGFSDPLDGFAFTLFENDTSDTFIYDGAG